MSEAAEETIIVTGKRLTTAGAIGGGFTGPILINYTQTPIPELLEQEGGKETVTTASFSLVNGDVVVRLPGYDFPIKVPAASWTKMSDAQKGAFIKLMTEFSQSPELVSFLNHLQSQGASVVEVYFDDDVHLLDGTTDPFQMADMPEEVRWRSASSSDETDLASGTKVIITINSDLVDSPKEFSEVLIHALGHPLHGVSQADEDYLRSREGHIYDQIFNTPGERETRPQDYYEGLTITGSLHGDNVTGGTGNDTLSGLSGNDILNGGLGNDLVMGGAGMDRLSGGLGDNMVAGGLDADTYAPAWGTGSETVVELGGVDRIDLSAYRLSDCTFFRTGDTLGISLLSGCPFSSKTSGWRARRSSSSRSPTAPSPHPTSSNWPTARAGALLRRVRPADSLQSVRPPRSLRSRRRRN